MTVTTAKFTAGQAVKQPSTRLGDGAGDEWGEIVLIPAKLAASVAFKNLKLRELCELSVGSILTTAHAAGLPVPVSVAGTFIGWAEFQVVGERLALRIADLE
jgi:flagellar motor switch/type III secretory pathway protein FliN